MTDWSFGGTWPYRPRYFESRDGRLHYIDEGDPQALSVVMLHGNPTWSYVYRECIAQVIAAGHRAIAIDHLGFGRSETPAGPELYTIERHTQRLTALLEHLSIRSGVFVLHDWAGPIALPYLATAPDVVSGLGLLNTFPPKLPGPIGSRGSLRALRSRVVGPFLVQRRNVPVERFLFKAGRAKPDEWDDRAKAAYRAPHPTPESRLPMLIFPRQIPFDDEHPVARASREYAPRIAKLLARKPVGILWGTNDVLFGQEVLGQWQELLPHADVSHLESAGHFLQEDEPHTVARAIVGLAARVAGDVSSAADR